MSVSAAKENILKRIRKALSEPTPLPFPNSEGTSSVYQPPYDEWDVVFAETFSRLQGKFVYCADESHLHEQLRELIQRREWMKVYCVDDRWENSYGNTISLSSCDVSITGCELLVARTGSIVLSAAAAQGRTSSVYAPVHVCIAYRKQLVYDVRDALQALKEKYGPQLPSSISFATGPSRTADIEKTLVTGVHGPGEVFLFFVDATD